MSTTTRWVLAHKRIVAAFWVVLTLVGFATVSKSTGAFSKTFSVPGREGFTTNARILRTLNSGGDRAPLLSVVTLPAGTSASSASVRAGLEQVETKLRAAIPGSRTASYASTGDRAFVSTDGRTTFVVAYPPPDNESFGGNTRAARAAAAAAAVPSFDWVRRDADPTGERGGGVDAAADRARQGRRPAGLAAPAKRQRGKPFLDLVGAAGRPSAVGRGGRRPGRLAAVGRGGRRPGRLAAGSMLDATVIRALLVPAVVSLLGRWSWWLPRGAARWLRVEPSLVPAESS